MPDYTKEFHLMRHKGRTMLAALVAVLALGVVASASASAALPEFVPGEGAKFPVAAEVTSVTSTVLENDAGSQWSDCQGVTLKGSVTGAKTASLTAELTNCRVSGDEQCHTSGAPEGHETLSGTGSLVYVSKATKQTGLDFTVAAAKILCGSLTINVKGSFVIPVTASGGKLNVQIKGSGGKPETKYYENEKGEKKSCYLETNFGVGYEESDLNIGELKLATSSPLTISA